MVADIEADKKKIGRHVVAHGGRHVVAHGHHMVANKVAAMVQILIAFEYFTKLKKWIHLFLVIRFAFHFVINVDKKITNCQGLLYIGIINRIELSWYHHQPESHQQSFKNMCDRQT